MPRLDSLNQTTPYLAARGGSPDTTVAKFQIITTMEGKDFFAKRATAFSTKLVEDLTVIDSVADIHFGAEFISGKRIKIDGKLVECFGYNQKDTDRPMLGFKVIETVKKVTKRQTK